MKILLKLCEEPFECDLPLHVYDEVDYPEEFAEDPEQYGDCAAIVEMPEELLKRFEAASDAFWRIHAELIELFEARREEVNAAQIKARTA